MAETWFTPKEWKARLVEFAGRRLLRNVANGETVTYDVSRSEGQVSQEGDAFNTQNMNDLEQRISNGFANAKTKIDALNSDLGGCSLEQEGGNFYIVGADAVRKKLGNDDVRMFTLSFPNSDGTCTLDNLDLTGDPNFIAVSTANTVWVDAVYNAIAPCGQTGLVSDKVKICAYAISQKIEYRDKSDVFPVCTKDVVTINYSPFSSGVGDKTTRVVIAHF